MKGIVFAGALSIILSFILTPTLIRILAKRGVGQMIRDDGPQTHHVKRGTPTMGGIVLILSTIIAYFASRLFTGTGVTASAILVINCKTETIWSSNCCGGFCLYWIAIRR